VRVEWVFPRAGYARSFVACCAVLPPTRSGVRVLARASGALGARVPRLRAEYALIALSTALPRGLRAAARLSALRVA
jgi:hypothetical protein